MQESSIKRPARHAWLQRRVSSQENCCNVHVACLRLLKSAICEVSNFQIASTCLSLSMICRRKFQRMQGSEQSSHVRNSPGLSSFICISARILRRSNRPSENCWASQVQGQGMPGGGLVKQWKVMKGTRARLHIPGQPRQGFPYFLRMASTPQADAGAVIPGCSVQAGRISLRCKHLQPS